MSIIGNIDWTFVIAQVIALALGAAIATAIAIERGKHVRQALKLWSNLAMSSTDLVDSILNDMYEAYPLAFDGPNALEGWMEAQKTHDRVYASKGMCVLRVIVSLDLGQVGITLHTDENGMPNGYVPWRYDEDGHQPLSPTFSGNGDLEHGIVGTFIEAYAVVAKELHEARKHEAVVPRRSMA